MPVTAYQISEHYVKQIAHVLFTSAMFNKYYNSFSKSISKQRVIYKAQSL